MHFTHRQAKRVVHIIRFTLFYSAFCRPALFRSILFIFFLTNHTQAQATTHTITLSLGNGLFNYQEHNEKNMLLNKEGGSLLSGEFHYQFHPLPHLTFSGIYSNKTGKVNYKGLTNFGNTFATKTDEQITSFAIATAYHYHLLNVPLTSSLAIRKHHWRRDILPRNGVSGLNEDYYWHTASLSQSLSIPLTPSSLLSFSISVLKIVNPTMKVDLTQQGYRKIELLLQEHWGYGANIKWSYQQTVHWYWGATLSHTAWRFGKSDQVTVSNGVKSLFVHEPKSESQLTQLSLFIQYKL